MQSIKLKLKSCFPSTSHRFQVFHSLDGVAKLESTYEPNILKKKQNIQSFELFIRKYIHCDRDLRPNSHAPIGGFKHSCPVESGRISSWIHDFRSGIRTTIRNFELKFLFYWVFSNILSFLMTHNIINLLLMIIQWYVIMIWMIFFVTSMHLLAANSLFPAFRVWFFGMKI